MTLIQLHEQLSDGTYLPSEDAKAIVPYVDNGKEVVYTVRRGREDKVCLSLRRTGDDIVACGSYFVGVDWVEQGKVAVQVNPKINDDFEVDYVRMLNDALPTMTICSISSRYISTSLPSKYTNSVMC